MKELNGKYHGCLRIGVTSLPPETVSSWKSWTSKSNASGDTKMTIVLDILEDGRLCVCSGGEVGCIAPLIWDTQSSPNCRMGCMYIAVPNIEWDTAVPSSTWSCPKFQNGTQTAVPLQIHSTVPIYIPENCSSRKPL